MKDSDIYPFRLLILSVVIVLFIGVSFYHVQEGLSWVDALYFTVITLTTVGYGDITPSTDIGKLFTILYIVIGIGLFATFINIMGQRRIAKRKVRRSKRKSQNSTKSDLE